ncbi:unnamed protein product [Blepharisma stoltei]|uniref:Potassium channel domain-containing protein n=1 Tax=Blepharisma stoltei TaxID=1481888 RepID=A0AAU9IWY7_9CILI|nr:unnamed protein product [Blepharisma stoltei]
MAVVIRQALFRGRGMNMSELEEHAMDNREALMRQEDLSRIRDEAVDEDMMDSNSFNEQEEKRKEQSRAVKNQLMKKKLEKIARYKAKLKIFDTVSVILSAGGVFLAFLEVENNFSTNGGKKRNESNSYDFILRSIITISTVALLLFIYLHHLFVYQIAREHQTTSEGVGSSFYGSIQFKWMWVEILFNAVHCPPGLDVEFHFEQLHGTLVLSVDQMLSCIMLVRAYILVRVVKHYTKWGTSHADQVCDYFGCDANNLFVLKSVFKDKPYLVLGCCMILSICIFGFAVRTFERPYNAEIEGQAKQNYNYVWNAFWLVIITMCTVGYGDFYPQTHMGRFVIVIACFWGVFLVSMTVVTLTESSEFSKGEARAYDILYRLKAKERASHIAKKVVAKAIQVNFLKRKKKKDHALHHHCLMKYNELMRVLQTFAVQRKIWKDWEPPVEEMLKQLAERIDVDLETLKSQVASVFEIEQQLKRVEVFQEQGINATKLSITYLEELDGQLDTVIQKMMKKAS